MLEVNIALLAACLGVLIPLVSVVIKASSLLRYLEGRIDSIKAEHRLLEHQINSSLSMIDYRIRDLEKFAENNTDFVVRHRRDDNTGAPFIRNE